MIKYFHGKEITFRIYQYKASEEILKVVKRHIKYRYDYEELKKKKEEVLKNFYILNPFLSIQLFLSICLNS